MRTPTGPKIDMRFARFFNPSGSSYWENKRIRAALFRGTDGAPRKGTAPGQALWPLSNLPQGLRTASAPKSQDLDKARGLSALSLVHRPAPRPAPPGGTAARRRDVARMSTSARAKPGRGADRERSCAQQLLHLCVYGAVARLRVRRLPGASGGLRFPAGAAAAGVGAALAVELAAAGACARAPRTRLP